MDSCKFLNKILQDPETLSQASPPSHMYLYLSLLHHCACDKISQAIPSFCILQAVKMWTVVKAWQQAYIIHGLEMDSRIHRITCNRLTSLTNIHADTQTGIYKCCFGSGNCKDYSNITMQMYDDHYVNAYNYTNNKQNQT